MRRRGLMAATLTAIVFPLLAGCGESSEVPSGEVSGEESSEALAAFAIDQDFPDPEVIQAGSTYYAYATNNPGANVQVATSTDLETWEVLTTDALPELPAWALRGRTWAPAVAEAEPGHFVMYFTTEHLASGRQCIGVATATSPTGPFTAVGDEPLICPLDDGGAIDAASFVDDDGSAYLLWKNDGNCCGLDTWLSIAPLSEDRTALAGEATPLLKQTLRWEGNLIEAPKLVKRDGKYILFYSANDYGGTEYATGYATATSPLGPYTKADEPLLTTDSSGGIYLGPGGQEVAVAPDGTDRLVFHSWDEFFIYRGMHVAPLTWDDGVPSVDSTP